MYFFFLLFFAARATALGEKTWASVEKVNAELFVLTYGALVAQLVKDCQDVEEVNSRLEQMGYNMGTRLVDEFMARSGLGRCKTLEDAAEGIARAGMKMFLGVTAQVPAGGWNQERNAFSLLLEDNPLGGFVEMPEECRKLKYSAVLCGVLRGALEMLGMRVECELLRDTVLGDDATEIRVTLLEMLQEEAPPGED